MLGISIQVVPGISALEAITKALETVEERGSVDNKNLDSRACEVRTE